MVVSCFSVCTSSETNDETVDNIIIRPQLPNNLSCHSMTHLNFRLLWHLLNQLYVEKIIVKGVYLSGVKYCVRNRFATDLVIPS